MPDERGLHADAARARESALVRQLRSAAITDRTATTVIDAACQTARRGLRKLDVIAAEIRSAVAHQGALALDTPAGARRFTTFLTDKTRDIQLVVAEAAEDSQAKTALLQSLSRQYPFLEDLPPSDDPASDGKRSRKPKIQVVDDRTDKHESTSADERQQNQINAFAEVFGREPISTTDWATAAALDPHTYDPHYHGVDSQVRVAKIRPEPGQGVVRVSQWIPQRDVRSFPPHRSNTGNNRGPDPDFDPADTKVTTYIDYENGIVVMRQNPSVELKWTFWQERVQIGVPQGSVAQADDGSVRIKYDAGNPFAPHASTDPNGPFGTHRLSANGDLVFTPGAGGVRVDGTRTDYPSLEVYQDLPNGTTRTVLIDPARSGRSFAPIYNLPFHHEIGLGSKAFEKFDRGCWDPGQDSRFPLPFIPFGPTSQPPSLTGLPEAVKVPA